jgi:hypothetical protein
MKTSEQIADILRPREENSKPRNLIQIACRHLEMQRAEEEARKALADCGIIPLLVIIPKDKTLEGTLSSIAQQLYEQQVISARPTGNPELAISGMVPMIRYLSQFLRYFNNPALSLLYIFEKEPTPEILNKIQELLIEPLSRSTESHISGFGSGNIPQQVLNHDEVPQIIIGPEMPLNTILTTQAEQIRLENQEP